MTGAIRGFAAAAISVLIAFAVTHMTWPLFLPTPLVLFYAAVAASAWLGGVRGGAAAVVLSAALGHFAFVPPYGEFGTEPKQLATLAAFVLVASTFVALIAARQRAAAREREQRGWLSGTLSSVGDAVIATDTGGRINFMNGVAERLTGWTAREAAGRPLDEVFAIFREGTRERAECPVRRALESGQVVGLANHTVLVSRGGQETPIEDSAAPIQDDKGQLRGVVLVFRDATERRRAEIAAEEARRAMTNVLESINDGFIAMDENFRHTYANGAAERITGLRREDLIGRTQWEVFPGVLGTPIEANYRRASEERVHAEFEQFYEPWSRWFAIKASPARDSGIVVYFRDITEQKQAASAIADARSLAEQKAREFDAMLSAVEDFVFAFDRDGRVLYANRALLDLWGVPAGGAVGRMMKELDYPEETRTRVMASIRRVFETGRPVSEEVPYRSPTGAGGHYEYTLAPVFDAAGAVVQAAGSARDTTARRAAEDRLRLLVEAGRVLGSSLDFEATLAGVCDLAVPGLADWCSLDLLSDDGGPRRVHVAHKDPAKVEMAREFQRRYPPDPDAPSGLMRVLRSGEPELVADVSDEMLVGAARDDEHLRLLRGLGLRSVLIVPLKAGGRTLGALTLVTADSSRRLTEDDLGLAQELASRAALAVENARLFAEAHEAIRVRDEAVGRHRAIEERLTMLVEASGSLSRSLELESVLGAVLDLSGRLIRADAYAVWRYRAATGRWGIEHASGLSDDYRRSTIRVVGETPMMPSGPILAADVRETPILGGRVEALEREGVRSLMTVPLRVRGEVSGTLVFYFRTPHGFGEIEARIATALANLAGSAIGTSELYEELRAADRRKDEFLAMLAHELRNPLAAVGNATSLATRSGLREHVDWAIEIITRQTKHLTRLIDDLLDVSRISRGKIDLRKDVLELGPILDSAVATVRPLVEERKHTLEVEVDGGDLWADVDPTRLEQVVVNLLNNAAKYSENGGQIRLSARNDGDEVVVSVRDRGVGIPPERLPEMFELFAQGDRSLARSEGGLGIGLTVVKRLVELHGGRVEARSGGKDNGSEFTIRIPRAPRPAAPESKEVGAAGGGKQSARILVVDDSEDTAQGMARLLTLRGHEVAVAHSGPEALRVAGEHRPDFVLLDIGLPGMDGYEVAARLRREDIGKGAVLIALTGYGQEEDRRRTREAGFDHHLVKPIEFDALVALLTRCPPP